MKKKKKKKRVIFVAAALCVSLLCGCSVPEIFVSEANVFREEDSTQEETAEPAFLQETAQNVRDSIQNMRDKIARTTEKTAEPESVEDEAASAEGVKGEAEGGSDGQNAGLIHADRYVYNTLYEAEKQVYHEIYEALQQFDEEITVSTKDKTVLDNAYDALRADYGELFWESGYTYTGYVLGGAVRELKFSPKYTMTKEEKEKAAQQIDAVVQEILAGAPMGGTDYEKALYVYEYLIRHVEYDANAADNQNIISVFLNGRTVCEGYARAAQYLLEKLGIQAVVVGGMARGGAHTWNLMRLDGDYYYMDVTWGDNGGSGDPERLDADINYNYFAVTAEELFRTHTPTKTIELPECNATENNYFVKNGLYVSEGLDRASEILREHYDAGESAVSLKFSNQALYQAVYNRWIADSGIFELCNGLTNLSYAEDRNMYVLTLLF